MSEFHISDIPAEHTDSTAPVEVALPTNEHFFEKVEQDLGSVALDQLNRLH